MERANNDDEQVIFDIIAGEGGTGEDDVSSYLNESGEGIEGQTNNDDEGNVGQIGRASCRERVSSPV